MFHMRVGTESLVYTVSTCNIRNTDKHIASSNCTTVSGNDDDENGGGTLASWLGQLPSAYEVQV